MRITLLVYILVLSPILRLLLLFHTLGRISLSVLYIMKCSARRSIYHNAHCSGLEGEQNQNKTHLHDETTRVNGLEE